MKKNKTGLPIKSIAIGAAIIITLIILVRYIGSSLRNSDYFRVNDISINKPQWTFELSYLLGRNIFDIDLRKESRYISELYPVYKKVGLFRILPDRLFVAFVDRKAIAYVKLYRDFCVDSEMVLFDLPQGQEVSDLPVIVGLERKIIGPKAARQYNIKELVSALNIIKEAEANNLFRKYKLERIDINSPANISCFIRLLAHNEGAAAVVPRAVEVKIGEDDIAGKVRVLCGLLNQFGTDISNINYIDLRFKEPVVKFNEGKR